MEILKSERISSNKHELQIKIDRASYSEAYSRIFRKETAHMTIPGFRPGKAPRPVIEKMIGKDAFMEETLNDMFPKLYDEAVSETKIHPVDTPELDLVSNDEEGIVIKVEVYVKPEVTIENYKGIAAEKTKVVVTDGEIDHELYHIRERNSREIEVTDRPAQMGDTVNIDYEGFSDGVAFEGGKDEGHDLKLGSNSFIPGFEEGVAGHSVGDEFDVNVTFPTEYHAEDLAGKEAVFKCKINAIKLEELPEADDEFAKDVSEFDTIAEYRESLKEKLAKTKEENADYEVESQIVDFLVENMKADIPEAMIDTEVENVVRDYDMRMRSQGLDLSTYLKYTGETLDVLKEQARPIAERQLKSRLALEKIAELEGLVVSDEELENEYKSLSERYGVEVDKVKESIASEDLSEDLKIRAAVKFVKDAASVTEVEPKDEDEHHHHEHDHEHEGEGEAESEAKAEVAPETSAKKRTRKKKETKEEPEVKEEEKTEKTEE
ncbi:MAG: trigger factor [Firmicutes bacterium]|nr:trigger factor [Bacillota bacterium]